MEQLDFALAAPWNSSAGNAKGSPLIDGQKFIGVQRMYKIIIKPFRRGRACGPCSDTMIINADWTNSERTQFYAIGKVGIRLSAENALHSMAGYSQNSTSKSAFTGAPDIAAGQ